MKTYEQDTRKLFRNLGTCSQTLFHIGNREFGNRNEEEERASDLLAGGLLQTGHQCGMLWGSAMAAGKESFRRYHGNNDVNGITISATRTIMQAFSERTSTHNCRQITGCDFTKPVGMVKFAIKSIAQLTGEFVGIKSERSCFALAELWAPEAVTAATSGLQIDREAVRKQSLSCASEVVKKLGGKEAEMATVAGFAGGMGLSGNACGALAAAIWMKSLDWCRDHPGESVPYFKNPFAKELKKRFYEVTGSKILCHEICGRRFESADEHTEFIRNGGCSKLVDTLASM